MGVFHLIFIYFLLPLIVNSYDYCLSEDEYPYVYFGTKTPYKAVRGACGQETHCKPIQFWLIGRHGTRRADGDEVTRMKLCIDLHKQFLDNDRAGYIPTFGGFCEKDLNSLRNWKWHETTSTHPGHLTEEGKKELFMIGQRYKTRYPNLFTTPYDPRHYYFRHTDYQRTNKSCRAFIDGIFGEDSNHFVQIETTENDDILLPFRDCNAWIDKVDNAPDNDAQQIEFKKSLDYQDIVSTVSKKLGFRMLLKNTEISAMYYCCRFEKCEFINEVSPWCSVFTKKHLSLLEYYDDLGRYAKYSYAHEEMNKKMGCMPVKHMMETFEKTVQNNGVLTGPQVTVMVAHDDTMDLMFTAMGFAKEQEPLSGTNYENMWIHRKYRNSKNIPFAANMVAVLHDCGDVEKNRYQVQFFLNERQMDLNGCYHGLCNWDWLTTSFSNYKDCNMDFCNETMNSIETPID